MGKIFIRKRVIESSELPDDLEQPAWDKAGEVHDWRNHVGWYAQEHWPIFTRYQKIILWLDAVESANKEEWE
jgi:hypothetical protein